MDIDKLSHTNTHTHIHTQTHTNTHTHTHIHTHTHTHIRLLYFRKAIDDVIKERLSFVRLENVRG